MQNLMINSALEPRQRNQSLTLNVVTCDSVENKADADSTTTVFVFASVKRSDCKAAPVMIRVTACSEQSARRELVKEYVISLAARLPIREVLHVYA